MRSSLGRTLPPRAFDFGRYVRWRVRYCIPRAAAAKFARQAPLVQTIPAGRPSQLADALRQVDLMMPTEFCRVMTWYGSDKGYVLHNYTTVYSALFAKLRNYPIRIFELGLGTNNPKLASSMGELGRPGASLRAWRDLFPRALVCGADIDREILFESDRIRTFYCDQLDAGAIRELWAQPEMAEGADIMIDDGLHTFAANLSFLRSSLNRLRLGGFYVVEDIHEETIPQWSEYLETATQDEWRNYEVAFARLPNKFNHYDNNLLILRRAS